VTVIDYLKLTNKRDIANLLLSILFAVLGTAFVLTSLKFDGWTLKRFEGQVKSFQYVPAGQH
jgi:hypothetical protein